VHAQWGTHPEHGLPGARLRTCLIQFHPSA